MFHILTLSIWVSGQVIYFFAEFTVLKNLNYQSYLHVQQSLQHPHRPSFHSLTFWGGGANPGLGCSNTTLTLVFCICCFFPGITTQDVGWYFQIYEKIPKFCFFYAIDRNLDERQPKAKCVSLVCKGHVGLSIAWGYGTMTDEDVFTQIQVRVDDCLQKMAIP